MTFVPRFLIITLAAFGATGLAMSALLPLLWRQPRGSAAARATALFRIRLMPVAASIAASLLAIAALARFEPREGFERTGVTLLFFAIAALATASAMVASLVSGQRAARRAMRIWMASAETVALPGIEVPAYAIRSPFPIVAIVGTVRPRLIVARSVLDTCSHRELRAIVAHERRHLQNHDNARRAILSAVPDVLTWLPFSTRITEMWHAAAEEAADDAAAQGSPSARVDLASALVRVARLAIGQPLADLPASALYRGGNENIECRVRRVLDGTAALDSKTRPSRWLVLALGVLFVISLFTLHPVHELVEVAVAYLP